jgi:hypothetical protein
VVWKGIGKGNCSSKIGHEGPDVESNYSSITLTLIIIALFFL